MCFLQFLAISLLFSTQQVKTSLLARNVIPNDLFIISRKLDETINDGLDSSENIKCEEEIVVTKNANDSKRETNEEGNKPKRKMFSNFELAILRCCPANKDRKVERCFEVNGFGGINFLKKPCRFVDMDQTIGRGEEFTENNNISDEQRIGKEQNQMLTKFELSIVRCCSSILDTKVGRCFEVNGFGGIHFLIKPCQLLEVVLGKNRRIMKYI